MNETVRLGRGAASSRSSDTEAYAVVVVVDVDVGGDDDDSDGAFVMVDDDEQESTSLQTILMLGLPWAAILFRWKGGEEVLGVIEGTVSMTERWVGVAVRDCVRV